MSKKECVDCLVQRRPGILQRGVPVAADVVGRGEGARGLGQEGAHAARLAPAAPSHSRATAGGDPRRPEETSRGSLLGRLG